MSKVELCVFSGRDDTHTIQLQEEDGTPLDLSALTKIQLISPDGSVDIDSDTYSTEIDFSGGNGEVELTLGDVGLPTGRYPVRVVTYDAQHPNGRALINECSETPLVLRIE